MNEMKIGHTDFEAIKSAIFGLINDKEKMQEVVTAEIEAYKAAHADSDIDALKEAEKELMVVADAAEAYFKDRTYSMSSLDREGIGEIIAGFLDTMELEWQYVPAMAEMYEYWTGPDTVISFGMLDSTLRILGKMQFKGYRKWSDIIEVNEYLSDIKNEYSADISVNIYIAQLHNVLLERMELICPRPTDPDTGLVLE